VNTKFIGWAIVAVAVYLIFFRRPPASGAATEPGGNAQPPPPEPGPVVIAVSDTAKDIHGNPVKVIQFPNGAIGTSNSPLVQQPV